jgi:ATP synthase protein I
MIQAMPGTDSHEGSNYARLFGVGFTLVFTLGILSAVGYVVDRLLGTLPLFLIVGLGLGFAGGLYYVYRALKTVDDG